MSIFKKIRRWGEERYIYSKDYRMTDHVRHIAEGLTKLLKANSDHDEVDAYANIIISAINALEDKGYDAGEVLDETYKEINSRVGIFDESIGKFVEDIGPEATKNWYKPDYSKCVRTR